MKQFDTITKRVQQVIIYAENLMKDPKIRRRAQIFAATILILNIVGFSAAAALLSLPKSTQAATAGQSVFYFHKEVSSANEQYNSLSLTPPEPGADTATTTGAETVVTAPPTALCEGSTNTGETYTQVTAASVTTTGYKCMGSFISAPVGQTISIAATDASAISGVMWSSKSTTTTLAATPNMFIYKWDGTTLTRIKTFTGTALTTTAATQSTFAATTPDATVTVNPTDRLVGILAMNVTAIRTGSTVSTYFDSTARAATQFTLKYTVLSPNKPTLTGPNDDDFNVGAAATTCTTAGVAFNTKWSCLQGGATNSTGTFNDGNTAGTTGDSTDWLWLRNQFTAAGTPSNFGTTPSNTYLYQTIPANYGDGVVQTVVNSTSAYTIGATNPATPYSHTGLVLWTSNTDYLEVQLYSLGATGSATTGNTNTVAVALSTNGTLSGTTYLNATVTAGTYNRVWLGFSKTGTAYQAQYSTDGTTWTNVGTAATHTAAFTRTGLNAYTGVGAVVSTYGGAFEWFRYTFTSSISGSIYQADEATLDTTAYTLALSINNATPVTTTTSAGAYTFSNVTATAGTPIAIYISGNATDANLLDVVPALGNDLAGLSGINLYVGRATVDNENAVATTNANVCTQTTYPPSGDNLFTCATSVPTFTGTELHVAANYTPGGNVISNAVHVTTGVTLAMAGNNLTVGNTATANSGGIKNVGTITQTTAGTTTIASSSAGAATIGGTGSTTFGNVSFLPTVASAPTFTLGTAAAQTINILGALTVGNGTNPVILTMATNNPAITVDGNMSLAANSTWTHGAGLLKLDNAAGTVTLSDANTTKQDLGAVQIGDAATAKVVNLNSSASMTSLNITALATFSANGANTLTLTGTGTPLTIGGTFTASTGTVAYVGATTATTITSATYNHLNVGGATTTTTFTPGGNITVGGNLTIVASSGTNTLAGSTVTINVAGNWVNSGAFTASTSTVNLNGAGASTQVVSGSTSFYNLTSTATTARTINFDSASTTTITGTWTCTGAAGQQITLGRNGGSGTTQWNINPTAWSVNYVTPANSNNQAATPINPTVYTDGGNNTNWFVTNNPPNTPTALTQGKTSGANDIAESAWTNGNQPWFGFNVVDPNAGDTVKYRIQIDNTDSNFTHLVLDYTYGTLSASGTTFAYQVGQAGTYTVGSAAMTLADSATGYWWRVYGIDNSNAQTVTPAYFGTQATVDLKVDATAPTGATIYDGNDGAQHNYNDYNAGSLTALSAYWTATAPNFNVSGAPASNIYQYAIGTTQGGTDKLTWTYTGGTGTQTYANATGLNLQTEVVYYFTVRAYDAAGNIGTFYSTGQKVYPTLSYSISTNAINFATLSNANSWTDSQSLTCTVSTNASAGYVVYSWINALLTAGSNTIPDFSGTWSTPAAWTGYGFGYTSNDTLVQGSNRFSNGTLYAAYQHAAPGDVVADHTAAVNGTTGAVSNEQFTITNKVAVSANQTAATYQTIQYMVVSASY